VEALRRRVAQFVHGAPAHDARQARLVDGASEVHRMVIARHLAEDADAFFDWNHLDRPKRSAGA